MIEPLESRIAPAAVFHYTDVDGDEVTIKTSKGTFANLTALGVLTFDNAADVPRQLQKIDLSLNAAVFAGTNVSVTAKKADGGDGGVNVGAINATGLDLGNVKVKGDLGQLDCGDASNGSGLGNLSVRSMGEFGATTQAAGDLVSEITGAVGSLKISGNIRDAFIHAIGADAEFGPVFIGGSVFGGAAASSGRIESDGNIASLLIKGSVIGGTGAASDTGSVFAGGTINSVTVGGSVIGGGGFLGGSIRAMTISHAKIVGNLIGGNGEDGGVIKTEESTGSVFVGGSIIGGTAESSGAIASEGTVGKVTVKGDLRGGAVIDAGVIDADDDLGSVKIRGSVYAGSGGPTGSITSENTIKKISIGGSVFGTSSSHVVISARGGDENPVAIESISIKGSVQFAEILGGLDDEFPANAAAQLGKIRVGGKWIASSAAAGIDPVNGYYGDGDDIAINNDPGASKIASIIIKGYALGTPGGVDAFGFVAREIGSLKIGTVTYPLTDGPSNDTGGLPIGASGDLRVREVA